MADRDAATQAVIDRLKTIYRENIMPVEKLFRYAAATRRPADLQNLQICRAEDPQLHSSIPREPGAAAPPAAPRPDADLPTSGLPPPSRTARRPRAASSTSTPRP